MVFVSPVLEELVFRVLVSCTVQSCTKSSTCVVCSYQQSFWPFSSGKHDRGRYVSESIALCCCGNRYRTCRWTRLDFASSLPVSVLESLCLHVLNNAIAVFGFI